MAIELFPFFMPQVKWGDIAGIISNQSDLTDYILSLIPEPSPASPQNTWTAVKSSDSSSSSNSTVWQEDSNLQFSLEANSKYVLDGLCFLHNADVTTSRTASFRISVPTLSECSGLLEFGNGTANQYPRIMNANAWDLYNIVSNTISQNAVGTFKFTASIVTGINSGLLQIQWKPNAVITDSLTLKKGSFAKLTKYTT